MFKLERQKFFCLDPFHLKLTAIKLWGFFLPSHDFVGFIVFTTSNLLYCMFYEF